MFMALAIWMEYFKALHMKKMKGALKIEHSNTLTPQVCSLPVFRILY